MPVVEGYSLTPSSVASVTMDANKTLSFTATAASIYEDMVDQYVIGDSVVVVTGNNILFEASQRARNERQVLSSTDGGIRASITTYGGFGFGSTGTGLDGRNDMSFGCVREGNNKITFFGLGVNFFESDAIVGEAIAETVRDGAEYVGIVNGVEIGRTAADDDAHKPHFIGDTNSEVNDIESYNFA